MTPPAWKDLLMKYRKARNRYNRTLAKLNANAPTTPALSPEQEAWDAAHDAAWRPYDDVRDFLALAVLQAHGLDDKAPIPRPVAVVVAGALLVVGPQWDDESTREVAVVEPADVLAIA